MKWRKWEELPKVMKVPEVREYYDILSKRKISLKLKRFFDIFVAALLLICLSPFMFIISIAIVLDSPGGVFYRQERVTTYCQIFRIHKFRSMVSNADKIGTSITVGNDSRITRVGVFLRKYRLDEFPQLIDILNGDMSFVGTRPEAVKYVKKYTPEMRATLLLPAGLTSKASIQYKDEAKILDGVDDVDMVYIKKIMPEKMKYNLESIRKFSLKRDIGIMFQTVFVLYKKGL